MTIHHDWNATEAVGMRPVRPGVCPDDWVADHRAGMTWSKRLFDIVFALLLLIPLSVVMLAVATILAIYEGRPIFYVSERMRAPGEAFNLIKFRTMAQVDEDAGATGAHKAWRITRLGKFLRRTRIDELPQLFNILRGDMSFVGPRPPLREYVERFPVAYALVLQAKPGVTGLATLIYHRHEDRIMAACTTADATDTAYYQRCLPAKLRIEMIYLRRRTLLLDLWIMWQTLKIVVSRRDVRPRRRGR